MADITVVAAAIRPVAHDPEDVKEFNAASGYTPTLGQLVQCNGTDDEVVAADANLPAVYAIPGVVVAIRRTGQGTAGYRLTVMERGVLEGFTGLPVGQYVYNSATAGRINSVDPSGVGANGRVVGYAKTSTRLVLCCPALPGQGGES